MASLLKLYALTVTVMVKQHFCRKAGSGKALFFLLEGMVMYWQARSVWLAGRHGGTLLWMSASLWKRGDLRSIFPMRVAQNMVLAFSHQRRRIFLGRGDVVYAPLRYLMRRIPCP